MKNARPGFVIDPYRFDGSFLTSMSDGIHCDYTHKTLEELRAGEDNPRLVTVSRNTADKMFRIHLKSKCLPFKEITESQYYEKELERQMEGHYRSLTFRGGVTKGPACAITGKTNRQYLLTPYFFTDTDGEKKFICNLVTGPDEEPDIRNARKNMAEILLSLRRHHFLYFSAHKRRDDMEIFLEEAKKRRHTLLANGKLLQFPMNRESVSFTGTVKETQEPFFFRIYDRDLFLYLLYALRNIRREKAEM